MLNVYRYRELLFIQVQSEIATRYKQSTLGPAWAVIQPLALMLVLTVLRSIVGIDSEGVPYPLFVFSALLPWTLFSNSITYATPKIVQSRAIIRKVYFPREVLPAVGVARALVDFAIAFVIFLGLMVYFQVPPTVAFVLIPALLAIQVTLCFGVALITSVLGVYRRDMMVALPLLTQFLMFLAPVLYPLSAVPEKYQTLYILNPMAGLIEAWRQVLVFGQFPEARLLISAIIAAVVVYTVGWRFFKKAEMRLADVA